MVNLSARKSTLSSAEREAAFSRGVISFAKFDVKLFRIGDRSQPGVVSDAHALGETMAAMIVGEGGGLFGADAVSSAGRLKALHGVALSALGRSGQWLRHWIFVGRRFSLA